MSNEEAHAWRETALRAMQLLADLAQPRSPRTGMSYQDRIARAISELQTRTLLLPAAAPPPDLIEPLAALEHERWAGWMEYLFSKGTHNPDGTWTMPAWAVDRWQRQAATPYADLTETEKDSDRAEVAKTLALIARSRARAA